MDDAVGMVDVAIVEDPIVSSGGIVDGGTVSMVLEPSGIGVTTDDGATGDGIVGRTVGAATSKGVVVDVVDDVEEVDEVEEVEEVAAGTGGIVVPPGMSAVARGIHTAAATIAQRVAREARRDVRRWRITESSPGTGPHTLPATTAFPCNPLGTVGVELP